MTNNKQSSIDWLIDTMYRSAGLDQHQIDLIIEQAKAMHREEHGKTWDKSLDNLKARGMMGFWTYTDFDDYYNETFNTHENNNRI